MNLKPSQSSQRLDLSSLSVLATQKTVRRTTEPTVDSKKTLVDKKRLPESEVQKIREKREHIYSVKAKATAKIEELGDKLSEVSGRNEGLLKELQKLKPPFLDHTSMPKPTSKPKGITSTKTWVEGDVSSIDKQIQSKTGFDPDRARTKRTSLLHKQIKFEKLMGQIEQLAEAHEQPIMDLRQKRKKLMAEAKLSTTPDHLARSKMEEAGRLRQQIVALQTQSMPQIQQLKQLRAKAQKQYKAIDKITTEIQELKIQRAEIRPQSGQQLLRKRAIDTVSQDRDFQRQQDLLKDTLGGKQLKLTGLEQQQSEAPTDLRAQEIKELKQEISEIKAALTDTLWESVKNMHINGVDSSSKLGMLMALDARQQEIDSRMKSVGKELGLPVIYTGEDPPDGPHIRITICGSSELSSDIDVNITAVKCPPGTDTEFVTKFNAHYMTDHGDESGNELDVNLYVEGVFPDWKTETKTGRVPLSLEAQKLDAQYQDVVSLIKVCKFAHDEEEWRHFETTTLDNVLKELQSKYPDTDDSELKGMDEYLYMQQNLTDAYAFVQEAREKIEQKIEDIKDEFPDKNPKELEMIANNRLFEELSVEADKIKQQYVDSSPKDDKILARAHFELCKAEFFANEAALGKGVLRRVVVNEQLIGGINGKRKDANEKIQTELAPLVETHQKLVTSMGRHEELLKQISRLEDLDDPGSQPMIDGLQKQADQLETDMLKLAGLEPTDDITDLDVKVESLDKEIKELRAKIQPMLPELDISPHEALQSFNENFGDILKEINHHSDDVREAAFRSSKYLGRMVRDVQTLLKGMGEMDESGALTRDPSPFKDIKELTDKFGKAEGFMGSPDKNLLLIRKDKLGDSPEDKLRLAREVMDESGLDGITTTAQYKEAIIKLSAELNAKVQLLLSSTD